MSRAKRKIDLAKAFGYSEPKNERLEELLGRGSVEYIAPYHSYEIFEEHYRCGYCGKRVRKEIIMAPNYNYCYICGHVM
jgi:hypothetical protein